MDCIKKYLSIGDETQKTGDKGTIEIAGFEIDAAMKRLGVPAEFIYTQLMSFAQSYRDSTELFDDMLRRDAKEAAAFVHKIKGSAGTIGIDSIHACAMRLEPKLKAGEVDYELVNEFKTIMKEAIEQIDAKISIKNQEATQDVDVNIAKSQLFELKELLQKRGYILVAKQKEVFSLIAPLIDGYLLDRLKDELEAFQYERALLSIEEIFGVIRKGS